MDSDERWDKQKYKNYVRGTKGLEFLQEGLHSFAGDRVLQQRDQTLQKITSTFPQGSPVQCNQCTLQNLLPEHAVVNNPCTKNTCIQKKSSSNCLGSRPKGRRKCPLGICSKMFDEIVLAHRFKNPMWKNSEPSTWCSDPAGWSFAKCFHTAPNPGTSSLDTDAFGLLSVILNDTFFQSQVTCNLSANPNTFAIAREVQNDILHSPKMELVDSKLQAYLDTFLAVLQDQKCLMSDQKAKESVLDLVQLKNNRVLISLSEQVKLTQVRKEALHALAWLENRERVTKMEEQKQEALEEIEGARPAALEVISSDLHKRLQQTEETIRKLTETIQKRKESLSSKTVKRDQHPPSSDITEQSGDVEDGDSATKETKQVIDKAWGSLIDYMKPDPILQYATEYELFGYRETRDIKEEKNTTEKSRKILEKLRPKGKAGYDKLIVCLNMTNQSILADVLECIKRGRDPTPLLEQIHEKATQDMYRTIEDEPKYVKKKGKLTKFFEKITFHKTRLRKMLKKDLVDFYRKNYDSISLSPLIEEEDTSLTKFYVLPNINIVKAERPIGSGKEEKTPVRSLHDVFYTNRKKCNEIYLTADAGMGKTCFSKRLALTWCQAHDPIRNIEKCFSKEEIDALKNFDLLFLLFLRDAGDECNIYDLIISKIVQELKHKRLSKEEIEELLSKERCLIILDGLDEWTHPKCKQAKSDVPHRKTGVCTVLTTSRPWKISFINLKSSEIDQRLELAGLDEESANKIKWNFLSHFTEYDHERFIRKKFYDFNADIKEKEISNLEAIPLLLMYLLCLYCENIELRESQCELYTNIIELLLLKTVQKYKYILTLAEPMQNDIPEFLRKQTHCEKFYPLLASLAQLAHRTLFNEAQEQTLVFDNEIADECLSKELLQVCLQAGILTQSKDRTKLTKHKAKISFAHKTLQEFFAALHMHSVPDKTTLQNKVLSQCNSVKDILEMSKVFIFLSGINVDVLSWISRELIDVIDTDELTREYRAVTIIYDDEKYTDPLKELQEMHISCVKENPQNARLKLFHQDIIIDEDCRQEKCLMYLHQLAVQNKENIRSVSIEMEGIPYSVQEIIDYVGLTDLRNVDKLFYQGEFDNCDITPLLQRSVKCLTLTSSKWQDNQFIPEKSTWSASLSNSFYSLDNLECIFMHCFEMSHDELEKLVKYLSARNSMREISLYNLFCRDHDDFCAGFSLELSHHSKLRMLGLGDIPLSELNINVASLDMCKVAHLSEPGLVSRFLSPLPAASKLQTFMCSNLEYTEDIETMLATLRKLVHVKQLMLLGIDLGNRKMLSTEMVNIEYVLLYKVTMKASVFSHLVNQVNRQKQTVTVAIRDCTITPKAGFEKEKNKIKMSSDFSVTFDSITQYNVFEFTTIKQCY